ncbi:MAG: hypothetical protein JJU15_00975 [Pararhodobacter sp.]|nr:hypothetical protein [Pararhodobacter sp.]
MTDRTQTAETDQSAATGAVDPKQDELSWQGRLELFAPLREGGPGRAMTHIAIIAISVAGIIWAVLADQSILADNPLAYVAGIGGFGAILTTLIIFLLRGPFRSRKVVFVLAPDHAEIRKRTAQEKVDAAVNLIADLATGTMAGQAVPQSFVPWADVTRVRYLPEAHQILLKLREINLRFHCHEADRYARAKAIVGAHTGNRR